MGKKGQKKHMKREGSPNFWPIHRKDNVWTVKSSPGPHGLKVSMPLLVVVRDTLNIVKTAKEAKKVIKQAKVLVDGKVRKDERFPIGLMDVVELPDSEKIFRVLPNQGGSFVLHNISKDESTFKLRRILGKRMIRKGYIQLNFHDGSNLIIKSLENEYSIGDVLKYNFFNNEIIEHVNFEPGIRVIITGGRSQGKYGVLIDLGSEPGSKRTATIRTQNNDDVRTLSNYVFAVGKETPLISLPGGK